ncbi:MAG: hypothetical protein EXS37_10185 [Opitutus sp.]|nr:hypothetical protein [Opitutus sp.]
MLEVTQRVMPPVPRNDPRPLSEIWVGKFCWQEDFSENRRIFPLLGWSIGFIQGAVRREKRNATKRAKIGILFRGLKNLPAKKIFLPSIRRFLPAQQADGSMWGTNLRKD